MEGFCPKPVGMLRRSSSNSHLYRAVVERCLLGYWLAPCSLACRLCFARSGVAIEKPKRFFGTRVDGYFGIATGVNRLQGVDGTSFRVDSPSLALTRAYAESCAGHSSGCIVIWLVLLEAIPLRCCSL